ncbi:MAG: amidohydrolase family protein [Planctomycetes bacterium]|nr:amidohydrolase family protein [Planctomycetota bacterium]
MLPRKLPRQLPAGRTTVRAAIAFPVIGPPIAPAFVTVESGRVLEISTAQSTVNYADLGDVALLPALVNAHTHLEFSDLPAPIAAGRGGFASWIRAVVAERQTRWSTVGAAERDAELAKVRRQGLEESIEVGVAFVGEIATTLDPVPATAGTGGLNFLELLGLDPQRQPSLVERARQHLAQGKVDSWHPGLSPHAPYTIDPELLSRLCALATQFDAPVAMHVAESREELELLRSHSGSLVDTMRSLDAWFPGRLPRGIEPGDYLRILSNAPRALVIHGSFLGPDDWTFLAAQPQMHVVFCPRTHAGFHPGRYPLLELLQAGVRVAVGTDSRASTPNLSMLDELRSIARSHGDVSPREILELGTIRAAAALGASDRYGGIGPGRVASFAAVQLPDESWTDGDALLEELFHSTRPASLIFQLQE